MPRVFAHLSDVHFGAIRDPHITGALVRQINDAGVDGIIISGDVTQRARRGQYQQCADWLKQFSAPVMVVPGNHDIPAWYWPMERLATPLKRYKHYISKDLFPQFVFPDCAILGINSAHGRTIKGGWVTDETLARVPTFFAQHAVGCKILVVHHPPVSLIPPYGGQNVIRNGTALLNVALDAGVNLIFCGHLHRSHVGMWTDDVTNRQLVLVQAGTASSNRGRGPDRKQNYFNFITITPTDLHVAEWCYQPDQRMFSAHRTTRFSWPLAATPPSKP